MKSITNDWLLSAESDLATIEKIADDQYLTHQVAFSFAAGRGEIV